MRAAEAIYVRDDLSERRRAHGTTTEGDAMIGIELSIRYPTDQA